MSSSNAQRFLADSTGDFGLSLKQYWGGVAEAFRDSSVIFNGGPEVIASKTITQGKTHQFMMMADTPEPENHTPGDELLGQQYEVQDGTITVDDILVAHHDIPLDQFLLSHFDIVGPLAVKDGQRLARTYDQRAFNLAINAARSTAVTKNGLSVHNGGNRVERVANTAALAYPVSSTGAQNFRADAAELAQLMDEDFVPEEGRYLFITPYIRRVLGMDSTIFDRDFTREPSNSLNTRAIGELEGFMVVVAKGRIPTTNVTSHAGVLTKYNGDFRVAGATGEPVALALCGAQQGSAAIGVARVMGPQSKMVPDDRRNTMFIKSQMLVGLGQLHPWCAGVIEVDAA